MRIMIVGCGKVGQTFAERLVKENHDVTVIDDNEAVVRDLGNRLDVIGYVGNGTSHRTLRDAGIADVDMFLAVTESDEVNMLCCLTAHKLGVRHTAARVRDPNYNEQLTFLKEDLGLSMVINPELSAAREISRILHTPSAVRVETFANGKTELVCLRIAENNPFAGMQLSQLAGTGVRVLFCAVERGGEVVIPDGSFVLKAGDTVYVTGSSEQILRLFRAMGISTDAAKDVIIAGGGRIAYYLADILLKQKGTGIKVIERDKTRAKDFASLIYERRALRSSADHRIFYGGKDVTVIHGDATDHEILQEEGISSCSAFVALTGMDEGNLLCSMYAASRGVPKVITKVNRHSVAELIHDDRMDSLISPRDISANRLVAYVRSLANASSGGGNIETMHRIANGQAEVLEFRAGKEGRVIHVQLKDLRTKPGVLIACISRGTRVIIPGGSDTIEPDDRVLVVTKDYRITKLSDILQER